MGNVFEFFEPSTILWVWILKLGALYGASAAFVMILGAILSRTSLVTRHDVEIRVWFAASMSLSIYAVLAALLGAFQAMYYKDVGISVFYAAPWVAAAVTACGFVAALAGRVRQKIRRLRGARRRLDD